MFCALVVPRPLDDLFASLALSATVDLAGLESQRLLCGSLSPPPCCTDDFVHFERRVQPRLGHIDGLVEVATTGAGVAVARGPILQQNAYLLEHLVRVPPGQAPFFQGWVRVSGRDVMEQLSYKASLSGPRSIARGLAAQWWMPSWPPAQGGATARSTDVAPRWHDAELAGLARLTGFVHRWQQMPGLNDKFRGSMKKPLPPCLIDDDRCARRRRTGVSQRTLRRWLQREDFQADYRRARRELVNGAIHVLLHATGRRRIRLGG